MKFCGFGAILIVIVGWFLYRETTDVNIVFVYLQPHI